VRWKKTPAKRHLLENGYDSDGVFVTMSSCGLTGGRFWLLFLKDANPAQAYRMPRLISRVYTNRCVFNSPHAVAVALLLFVAVSAGCDDKPTVRQYRISGKLPPSLITIDRMLAAIIPQDKDVWFVKVVGPAKAIEVAEPEIAKFVKELTFTAGVPDLKTIPSGWNRGGEKPMRVATLLIDTPEAQLDVSISKLPTTGDWDEQVALNVNRWRGQMKLSESSDKWAGATPLAVAIPTDKQAVWVDLTGEMAGGSLADSPAPFAPRTPLPPMQTASQPAAEDSADAESPLKFETPEGWRPGKKSMMRLEAFNIGPEDATAELTIISAGGDLRGNVARWLGQVRGDTPPDEVVDAALAAAESIKVSGRDGQRYYLSGGDTTSDNAAQAIDATIVPMESGMSLFIKATGPTKTLENEKERIGDFIRSLQIPSSTEP
jgi:hypothetical protein